MCNIKLLLLIAPFFTIQQINTTIVLDNHKNTHGPYSCWIWGQTKRGTPLQITYFSAPGNFKGPHKWVKIANVGNTQECENIFDGEFPAGTIGDKWTLSGYILTKNDGNIIPTSSDQFINETALECGKCYCSYNNIECIDEKLRSSYCGHNCPE